MKVDESGRPQYCDMVMKGGITSGVVYPLAICELAALYTFRNIGGASAGAIAAAGAAAAEFGRQNSNPDSFKQLAELPPAFATTGFLPGLFKPAGSTRPIFMTFLAFLEGKGFYGKIVAVIFAILRNFWMSAVLGILVGAGVAAVIVVLGGLVPMSGVQWIAIGALSLAWIVAGLVLVTVIGVFRQSTRTLVQNGFGLSNGLSGTQHGNAPLTNWMHGLFNKLAGLPSDRPLVFGDLWKGSRIDNKDDVHAESEKRINLEVVTTNLNHQGPYRVPFKDRTFYFDPNEWALLFPVNIMKWIELYKGHTETPGRTVQFEGKTLTPLPEASMLPIVVAARLSLSFPGLVSAVPLYSVDFSLKRNQVKTGPLEADKCWFSDGGICSNFPVHFFDSPIPRWPTFAINLKDPHPDHPDEMVWFPPKNDSGILVPVKRFDNKKPPAEQLVDFVGAIFTTMMDWRDNLQTRMPGYRNRIVHIVLKPGEGGLNLTMDSDLTRSLTERGRDAGRKLINEFDWPQHVWARYRLTMSAGQRYFTKLARAFRYPFSEDHRIHEWLTDTTSEPTPGYQFKNAADKKFAADETERLAKLGEDWGRAAVFTQEPPAHATDLAHQPKF